MAAGSVIIVSHNSEECVESCLRSLAQSPAWKVLLVDNASSDRTVELAKLLGLGISIISNSQNRGFAGAVNQGVIAAEGEILVILNPDAVASPGALDELKNALAPENVAAAGAMLIDATGELERGFAIRRFPILGSALAEVLLLNRIWPGNPWNRTYRCLDLNYTETQQIDQPAGACLAVKRKAFNEVNGFDIDFYPVWFEDVDFCRRLRDRNWSIVYWPRAVFSHGGGHSVRKVNFRDRQAYWYSNLLRYFAKHHSAGEVFLLRTGVAAGLILRLLGSLLGAGPKDLSLREAFRGYSHALWEYAVLGKSLRVRSDARPLPSAVR